MSKRKDRNRAKQLIYRNGAKIPKAQWDKYQRELRELEEAQRLAALGLVSGKSKILTPEDVMKGRETN